MSKLSVNLYYKPHALQEEFHNAEDKFKAFIGGVGSGKTYAGCFEAIKTMLQYPNSMGMVTAPTYKMLKDATIKTFFEILPRELVSEYKLVDNKLRLVNGSECLFRSADDPETLRGPNAGWWFGDEAAMYSKKVWDIMIGRLRREPSKAWITSTPKGFTWIHEKFVKKKLPNYKIIYCATTLNPYLPKDYVQSLKDSYSGIFAKQEIEGLFVAHEGLVYEKFNREINVGRFKTKEFKEVVAGIDWGYTNPMVLLVVGFDSDDRAYIIEEFYQRKVLLEDFSIICKDMQEKYNIDRFYADPSEPANIQQLQRDGISIYPANNEVMNGIIKVSALIEKKADGKPRLFVDETCINTIMEFENYAYPEDKEGRPTQENPIKLFDHSLDVIRYIILSRSVGTFIILEDKNGVIF